MSQHTARWDLGGAKRSMVVVHQWPGIREIQQLQRDDSVLE